MAKSPIYVIYIYLSIMKWVSKCLESTWWLLQFLLLRHVLMKININILLHNTHQLLIQENLIIVASKIAYQASEHHRRNHLIFQQE